jgi:NAD(P)-dependent dehydrogenase (short-subunit alcohol dehydrogenase family)
MQRFAHKHVLVTGAGTGIGQAIALRLVSEGAAVSLAGRRREPLEATRARIAAAGGRAQVVPFDVAQRAAVRAGVEAAARGFGPLHALVANAGIGGPNQDGPQDRFEELVRTNLLGSYQSARAALEHLAPGPGPRHLLFIASILARIGVGGYTGYCASKAALLGLTRSLAMELAPEAIQVNALCPGWVDTDMARQGIEGFAAATGQSFEQAKASAMAQVPLGRMASPEEVAALAAYALSDEARGLTGQALDLNGGAWMG